MSGKRAKALRRAESDTLVKQVLLNRDLQQLDIWTDPDTGEIFFTPKEESIVLPDKAPDADKEYANETRPICVNCGKRQNETHHVVLPLGEFFICDDDTSSTTK